jgi:hypothetical protein
LSGDFILNVESGMTYIENGGQEFYAYNISVNVDEEIGG